MKLEKLSEKVPEKKLSNLKEVTKKFGNSWSGSWWGYQSRIYYTRFQPVPPGARFSQEWGTMSIMSNDTNGEWAEFKFDDVVRYILEDAGIDEFEPLKERGRDGVESFEDIKAEALSTLSSLEKTYREDVYLTDQLEKLKAIKCFSSTDYITCLRPSGSSIMRDMVAVQEGMCVPAHISVEAEGFGIEQPFTKSRELAKLVKRLATHLENQEEKEEVRDRRGINVFIAHGRSMVWRDLKDFIQERLRLPYDEFNRVPVAGTTNITRLSQMLDKAAIAFIVMTAEDEQADGQFHARMNVIHEAGLFQGRLGFERAILLLEEGCEEFSNVQGLGQIRFPKGDIKAKFEEIREVLEREEIIEANASDKKP